MDNQILKPKLEHSLPMQPCDVGNHGHCLGGMIRSLVHRYIQLHACPVLHAQSSYQMFASSVPSKSEVWSLSLFLFFPPLNLSHKPKSKCNPPRVPLARNSSPIHPPPPTLSFGWLLRFPVKWRPSKTGAPPISQFFYGCHFGAAPE